MNPHSWILTYTGKRFDVPVPKPEQIDIVDIANQLHRVPRFCGATMTPYSVCQHSILVARLLPKELKFQGLMHDATEAYIGDLATPFKALCTDYKIMEGYIWEVIAAKYNLPSTLDPAVKAADKIAYYMERSKLMPEHPHLDDGLSPSFTPNSPVPWQLQGIAVSVFLEMFKELS